MGGRIFYEYHLKKSIMQFGNIGTLSRRHIGIYEIMEQIGTTTCQLIFRPEWSVYDIFHASMLRKCIPNMLFVLTSLAQRGG